MVLFLFGISGSGKSFVGQCLAEVLGWHVYEADQDITDAMRLALAEHRPFTNAMRDEYFTLLVEKIQALQAQYPKIIVTQACYKQRHRDYLLSHIDTCRLVHIHADETVILSRIKNRKHGISIESARALIDDFEFPVDRSQTINNNGSLKSLAEQALQLANKTTGFGDQDLKNLEHWLNEQA